jgi:hypothetical protein
MLLTKAAARMGTSVGARDWWLEVGLHPEGLATGQLDGGFPWISLLREQVLGWCPNSALHCVLHMRPSQ